MVQLYKILPKSIFILSTFYFYFFCLPSNFGQTPLNGVYTIGGDNPDFGNFTEAVDSLNLKGVSGSVTFDVRDGTYEGRATITEFANPDGQYSVIFQSESGNQEFVTWKYNDFSAPVEILEIDGADNITFRNITFEASGNNVSAIVLRNEANNNSFENLMISNNTYTGLLIILKSHNISINNCYFSSSIPISTSEANDLTISNNYFEEKDGYSISLRKQDNILISNNVLNNVNGIFLREANNFSVEKNKFTNDGYSIYTIDCNENQGAEGLITNNFIKSTLGNLIKNSSNLNIFHNTIRIANSSDTSFGIKFDNGNNNQLLNNIFANFSGSYAIQTVTGAEISIADHNAYFTSGSNLARLGEMDFVSLTDWQAATSWDANSLQTNPQFIEPDDYPINNTELNNTGSTLAKITDDIEGEARDLTQPDIGADEFGGVAFDCSSDLILLSDSAVNDFVTNFPNCTEINGDLILSSSDLTTVAALGQLIRIKGDLRIINSALSNLNGLENIVSVSNVTLTDNINLSDISQLSSLTTIQGNLTVSGNSSLKSSTLFPNLSSIIGKLAFINNDSLTGIEGFPKLTAIGGLKLEGNAFLSSLDGLISINTLGDSIEIINNAALNKCNIDVVCQHISAEKAAIIANNSTACTDVETVTSLCQNGCATGLVFLNSQEKIDLFIASNSDCDTLHGDLLIRWNEVTDISGLGFLKVINGYLRIADTRNLTNLNGLENLTTIDSFLLIQDCTKLFNLQGLRSLQKVGGFLALDGNWLLQDIDGLAQIDQINGNLSILDNIRLQNVDGLSQIQAIQGNVEIKDNDNLADCSSICPFINEEIVSGSIGISNNALGCSNLDDVKVSCASNDCSGGPAVVTNMLPEDGATGLASSVSFSWIPVENATQYFFKIWKEGEEIPALPNRITTQNNVNYGIAPLTTYNWQIISADDDCSTASPIQSFTTASFENADLVVPNVAVPVNPFSGQTIELSWEVKNQGSSSTEQAGWYDYVFLSKDSLFQFGIDQLLGASISQLTLDVNQNTTQQLQATLPNGIEGTHYIFVITDQTDVITEIEEANNISVGYPMSVNLTPPPDLIVADIITPGTAFAGSAVNVTWSVINKGIGDNVEPFTDYIYFSDQPTFNRNEATLLKEVTQTPLAKGDTITQTTQITLPVNVFGPHFIHIWTDAANEVYEFASEDNNIKSSNPIEVIVNPPPDLIVSDIRAKDIVSNKERVLVEWTVRNIGASATSNNLDHQIYLSPSPNFDLETAVKLLVSNASQAIQPGDSLTISNTINIPNNITGDYYLFVETDHSNLIFELENEDNNLSAAAPITVQNADLLVVNLAATPVPASSGKTIELTWTTVNQGLGNAINSTIFDRIYISSEADFSGDATSIGSTSYQSILAGDSLHLAATLQLPYGLEGEYYIHLLGDADNIVFENNATQNNVASFLISVELPPSPDLEITSLTGLPTNALAGTTLQLAYTVKNNGLAAITDDTSWTDKIFISDQPIWDFNKSKLITEITVDRQLGIDSSYTNEISFVLPMLANEAPTGVCYIYVYTDFNEPSFPTVELPYQSIFEHTDENNNTQNHQLAVTAPDPVDFSLVNASTLPDTLQSGKEISIEWTVQNIGNSTALWGDDYPLWYDGFYLSRDSIWSNDDLFVKDFTQQGPIDSLERYTKSANFNIPDDVSGTYYLILVTDHTNVTNDINAANDSWIIQPTNSTGVTTQSIYIELSPTADLVLSKLDAPANSISGQAIQVNWSVKNEGIVNPTNTWTDKIYLSTDFTIDSGDEIIGTKTQNREVAFGETYFDSLEVFIPIEAEGNYILIVKTDANNELFEVAGETNNQATQPITTELPLPADLVVSAISSADMMVVGQPFTINYTLENQGVNPAKGQFKDLIYLSKDSLLDATDLPITEPISRREDIVPLATVTHEVTATVPGVSTGSYYLLVDTDIQNNIHEIEEDNNLGMTPYKLEVTVPELIMNQSTSAILTDNTNIYYRIDIPQDLVNETMQVTLDALGDEGFNELYLRYGDIPSRATHDFSFSNAFSSDQAIVVPELVAGTYYVLVYGNNQVVAPPQEITLRAEIVPFQLTTVTQNKGGNSGPVTVKLEGSKFEPNMKVELKMGENTLSGFNLDYINSTEVYITFNLGAGDVINTWFREGIATGFYDVIIEKENGAITTLENGIEVIEGAPPSLKIDLVYPENVRVQRVVPMTINFTNNGYGNIPTPTYSVLSLRGAPIALSVAELKEEYQSVVFQLRETDGPADVLRPGASGSITIYAFSSQALTFKLVELN